MDKKDRITDFLQQRPHSITKKLEEQRESCAKMQSSNYGILRISNIMTLNWIRLKIGLLLHVLFIRMTDTKLTGILAKEKNKFWSPVVQCR